MFNSSKILSDEQYNGDILYVYVNGLVCDFCARSIEKIFSKQKSVAGIKVNLENMLITINFKENQNLEETIDVIFDSSFKIKSKPKPNQKVVISALTDSLTGQIESMTSYDPNQSAFIQVGAFKKENVSEIVAADISKKLGARVEVRPTLVSDPVMYRILIGPEHKDQINQCNCRFDGSWYL